MANKNMTYKIAMWLDSSQVGKGAAKAKSALAGLKSTIMSMTAALVSVNTISGVFRRMAETAKELSTARIVLENVSKSTKEFAENQQFVNKLAKDYKQDVIALMSGYAQFKAASDAANVSLEDSRKIYESLTRAAAYYNLSSEQTSNMMNAIVQMMSKGKVAAEELRRQLGNAIPGAVAIMQKAVGATSAEFEKMLKNGELMSAEVLPKFADELNNITADIKITSLQSSLNELKNTFTDLVENLKIEQFSKKVVDAFSNILKKVNSGIQKLKDFYATLNIFDFNSKWDGSYQEKVGDDGVVYYRKNGSDWIEKPTPEPTTTDTTTTTTTTTTTGNGGKVKKSALQTELDRYIQKQKELENQYKNGVFSEEEFKNELNKLIDKTWPAIAAISDLGNAIDRLKSGDKSVIEGIREGYSANRDAEAAASRAAAQKQADENVDDIFEAFSNALGKTLGKRDTSLDFMKDDNQILEENTEFWKNQSSALQDLLDLYDELLKKYPEQQSLIDALFADVEDKLNEAVQNADNLKQALTAAQYLEYVKNLQDNFNKASFDGFKTAAESLHRLTEGFQSLKETLEDDDASGWEKMLKIINEIIQAMETLMAVMEAFDKIKKASAAMQGTTMAGGTGILSAIFPELGLVTAILGIFGSLFGGLQKFSTGGIVGGNSFSGDKGLARVNSGEMVLNKKQQGNLFNMLSSSGVNGGNVNFKIQGKDLVGVLSNYNQQRKG